MKITIKKILFLLMLLLFSATSCDGFFDENETEENLLPEPTITKNNESIIISCNAGSSDSFSWINIFRREKITNATEDAEENEFINIGQVLPFIGQSFSNSAQFVDKYVAPEKDYEYYIRYATKHNNKITYSKTEIKSIKSPLGAIGELKINVDGTNATDETVIEFTYNKNYTLTTTSDINPSLTITEKDGQTEDVCLAISNEIKTIPFPLENKKELNLRTALDFDFLDKDLSFKAVTYQITEIDEINKCTSYYWSKPVKVKIKQEGSTEEILTINISSTEIAGEDVDYYTP